MSSALILAAIFLAAAAFFAPVAKRLGLGSVIGYLLAGIIIGPSGIGFISAEGEVDDIMHLAEFGVILLLFLIGLELRPSRLYAMRADIFGAGTAQVVLTAVIIGAIGYAAGLGATEAAIIGAALALSSTAFVLQFLGEKGHLRLRHGRLGFSVLLLQDIAAVPFVALIPIVGSTTDAGTFGIAGIAKVIVTVAVVLAAGRYVLRYVYDFVAATGVKEGMIAAGLLTVVGVTLAMEFVGLSPALGAFLAGMLISDSQYRHEMEANIAPFERILLGVFFTAIGMTLDLQLLMDRPGYVIGLALGLMAVKGAVLFGIGLWRGLQLTGALYLAVALAQGGEFAFVLFSVAGRYDILSPELKSALPVAVTLSMAFTPLLFWGVELLDKHILTGSSRASDPLPEEEGHVIVAGFTPFGQIVARILAAKRIPFTALDKRAEVIDFVRRFGATVFYGDANRPELLAAAQADKARAFVVAVRDPDEVLQVAETVRRLYPDLPVYSRAYDRLHAFQLLDLGVNVVERETFYSALDLTEKLLVGLGESRSDAHRAVELFRKQDEERFEADYPHHKDMDKVTASAKRAAEELERQFREDRAATDQSEKS